MGEPLENPIERTGFKVAALVLSKLRRREIGAEYQRLQTLTRGQARLQVSGVLLGLFLTTLLAASFGWIGLAVYFLGVVLIFR
ncbi:MAG: hypothetical protein AAF230_03245 [Pseudomonadota bacterium]